MDDHRTVRKLREARAQHTELGASLDLYIAILEARARLEEQASDPSLDTEQARARLAAGQPVLSAPALALDWQRFGKLAREICDIVGRSQQIPADACSALAELSAAGWTELAREYLACSQHRLLSDSAAPFANLQEFVVNNALHPFLSRQANQARTLVASMAWERAFCPVCGGTADFAALEKDGGARRLLCSRCDCEWSFDRSICSYCGTDRHVGYFPVGQGAYRLYVCEGCKHYLKTIDLRELARDVDLPAERVLTLGLDVAAVNAGYSNSAT